MHELSVSSAIVDTAIRHARGRRVTAVHIRVGALRQVVEASLSFYFGVVSRGTLCEDAYLDVTGVAALMHCRACGNEWDPAPDPLHDEGMLVLPQFRCPACDEAGAEVVAGDELLVDSIDVEETDAGAEAAELYAPDPAAAGRQGG